MSEFRHCGYSAGKVALRILPGPSADGTVFDQRKDARMLLSFEEYRRKSRALEALLARARSDHDGQMPTPEWQAIEMLYVLPQDLESALEQAHEPFSHSSAVS
jgi:hypothetical protein